MNETETNLSEQAMQAQWIKTGLTNRWSIPRPEKNPVGDTDGASLKIAPVAQ